MAYSGARKRSNFGYTENSVKPSAFNFSENNKQTGNQEYKSVNYYLQQKKVNKNPFWPGFAIKILK